MRLSVITAQLLWDGKKNAEIPQILCVLSIILPKPTTPTSTTSIGSSFAVLAKSRLKCLFVLVLTHKRVNSSIMVRDVGIKAQ